VLESLTQLEELKDRGELRPIDYWFADLLYGYADHWKDETACSGALISYELGRGHIFVDLDKITETGLILNTGRVIAIDGKKLRHALEHEVRICSSTPNGVVAPLVLEGARLYLYRYWKYEQELALKLQRMLIPQRIELPNLVGRLDALFQTPEGEVVDYQKLAVVIAMSRKFSLITGGPGTGKTTSLARLILLLLEQGQHQGRNLRIELAAPTGKAAARVNQALTEQFSELQQNQLIDNSILAYFPRSAATIHRLLGANRNDSQFRHGPDNPLPLDVLILDECSMIDLRLMHTVVDALPADARLIMVGDRNQLASVEAGNVFGELSNEAGILSQTQRLFIERAIGQSLPEELIAAGDKPSTPLGDASGWLNYSYRFQAGGAIGRLAEAVNRGDAEGCQSLLSGKYENLQVFSVADNRFIDFAVEQYGHYLRAMHDGAGTAEVLRMLDSFRILCAMKNGPAGVMNINLVIEQALREKGLIESVSPLYSGEPIMISRNDYQLKLYNGDVGLIVRDAAGNYRAYFMLEDGELRSLSPARLPPYETVFAMTVHKSQGSEFDQVLLVLPELETIKPHSHIRKELLYTGITRAKLGLSLALPEGNIPSAWLAATERDSSLAERVNCPAD